jgi:hypothetical protein
MNERFKNMNWQLATACALCAAAVVQSALSFSASSGISEVLKNQTPDDAGARTTGRVTRPEPADIDDADWTPFQNVGRDISAIQDLLSKRFRLAGTFFMYTQKGSYLRKAIVDDLAVKEQRIVAEGDGLDELFITRILRDRIIVRDEAGREIEIWQSNGGDGSSGEPSDTRPDKSGIDTAALAAFGGKYTGENRWSFERSSLLRYYKTLLDNPDRLVLVFDSMKPVYNQEKKIDGYRVAIEGEGEFFAAVGLRDGDVVRTVNEIRMTNRRRAEHFIKNFALGRNSAFILEVERKGDLAKQIYQMK